MAKQCNKVSKDIEEIIQYKKQKGNDNIQYKETIKEKLINNSKIIYSLNNKDLEISRWDYEISVYSKCSIN